MECQANTLEQFLFLGRDTLTRRVHDFVNGRSSTYCDCGAFRRGYSAGCGAALGVRAREARAASQRVTT